MEKSFNDIRPQLNLNGEWILKEENTKTEKIRAVPVPSDISVCIPEDPYASGLFRFEKTFVPDGKFEKKRIVLRFEAVNYSANVWLNGKYLGHNDQGFLPFEFEITDAIKLCESNLLSVCVDTRRKQGQLPTSFYWKNSGGIIRSVCIYATEKDYIEDAFVSAGASGTARFTTKTVSSKQLTLRIAIKNSLGELIGENTSEIFGGESSVCIKSDSISPWSPESPSLYTAEITLRDDTKLIDTRALTFGYRDISAKNGKLFLNGKEIFLKGFNRHEDHPLCGGAENKEIIKKDLEMIKESGANFIRLCHYPHSSCELDLADELGLAVLDEIPLCAYMGDTFEIENSDQKPRNEEVFANAAESLERMIVRDRNHPSVLIWSVSNENREPDNPDVADNHKALLALAKKLDPTRLATHVSTYSTDPDRGSYFVHDDVICFNAYPTVNNRIDKRNGSMDFSPSYTMITTTVAALRELFPDKPIILTEFGYRTHIPFDGIESEHIQALAVSEEFRAASQCANGASVWLFADHLWPIDHRLPSNISRYGLLDRNRNKKEAYDVFCELLKNSPK